MKTNKQIMDELRKKGGVKKLTPEYVRFEEEGDSVLGRFVSVNEVESSINDDTYNQYLFQTAQGPVKFCLGKIGDKEIAPSLKPGKTYYIEFLGKEKTAKGFEVKKYDCEELGDIDPSELDEEGGE